MPRNFPHPNRNFPQHSHASDILHFQNRATSLHSSTTLPHLSVTVPEPARRPVKGERSSPRALATRARGSLDGPTSAAAPVPSKALEIARDSSPKSPRNFALRAPARHQNP